MTSGYTEKEWDDELIAKVRLAARIDHESPDALPVQLIKVERISFFPKPTADGDIGEIEVTYSRKGERAIYGFSAHGKPTLYAD